jgi:hypothetical protein
MLEADTEHDRETRFPGLIPVYRAGGPFHSWRCHSYPGMLSSE